MYIKKWCEEQLSNIKNEQAKFIERYSKFLKVEPNYLKNSEVLNKIGNVTITNSNKQVNQIFEHQVIIPSLFYNGKPNIGPSYIKDEIIKNQKLGWDNIHGYTHTEKTYLTDTLYIHYNVCEEKDFGKIQKINVIGIKGIQIIFNAYIDYLTKFLKNLDNPIINYETLTLINSGLTNNVIITNKDIIIDKAKQNNKIEKKVEKEQKLNCSYMYLAHLYNKNPNDERIQIIENILKNKQNV